MSNQHLHLQLQRSIADAFDVPRAIVGLREVEDVEHDRLARIRWMTNRAWQVWRMESCVEFNGGHAPMLLIDGGSCSIECEHGCPLTLDDYYPDGIDLLNAYLPVTINIRTEHHRGGPWGADEWDAWVELEPRND